VPKREKKRRRKEAGRIAEYRGREGQAGDDDLQRVSGSNRLVSWCA
jgi:hypothetical protein